VSDSTKVRSRGRALVAFFTGAFSFTFAAWAVGTGCTWPDYTVDLLDQDATFDDVLDGETPSTTDTLVVDTAPYKLPDGRVCTGHDEDLDGVPDECDNCPNVVNPTQTATGTVGDACKAPPAMIPSTTRLYFDPFKKLGTDYKQFPMPDAGPLPFTLGTDTDSIIGGVPDPETPPPPFRFIVAATGADTSAVTVTTVMTMQLSDRGNAGILLRVNGAPAKFFICALSVDDGFAAAHAPDAGCNGGPCGAVAFPLPTADGGAIAAQVPIPADIPHALGDAIGFRATVTKSDTTGDFECRVFNPKVPATLTSTDAKYAVKVTIPSSRWLAAGEIGLYSQRAKTQFHSLDVLRSP
jgi:hypothetical protein